MATAKGKSTKGRAAKKKIDSTPSVPALKPSKPPAEKKTCKLTPVHVQLIIDMTISGYTNGEILKELKDKHGVTVGETTLCYQRRQNIDKLQLSEEEQLRAARARSPYMQLSTRIATLERAIDREMKKKNSSGYAVSMLMGQIDTAIKNAEVLKLKREELARKLNSGRDGQVSGDEYVKDMENRSRVIKEAEYVEAQIVGAGAEDELIIRAKIESPEPPSAPAPVPEESRDVISVEELDNGIDLDESALRA